MSEVIRYDAVHIRYEESNIRYGEGCEVEVVTARDYDALAADNKRLREDRDSHQRACMAQIEKAARVLEALEEVQWQHIPADDHYHKPAGFYCPSCGNSQAKGHATSCDIGAALAGSKEGDL